MISTNQLPVRWVKSSFFSSLMKPTAISTHHFKSKKKLLTLNWKFPFFSLEWSWLKQKRRTFPPCSLDRNPPKSLAFHQEVYHLLQYLCWRDTGPGDILKEFETWLQSKTTQQKSSDGFPIPFQEIQYQRYKENTPVPNPWNCLRTRYGSSISPNH